MVTATRSKSDYISYEFWRGTGLDGAPVVAIATGFGIASANRKTGDMIQTYILRADMSPVDASRLGLDRTVCGECPLRQFTVRTAKRETGVQTAECYVNLGWLTGTWNKWNAGKVEKRTPRELGDMVTALGLPLRQGAYGDPAVVPQDVWAQLDRGRGTSYSHQWRTANVQAFAMASVTTLDEAAEAQAAGYRTYRVDVQQVGPQENEITCPAESRGVSCADCGLCNGNRGGTAKNIVIHPMGKFQ